MHPDRQAEGERPRIPDEAAEPSAEAVEKNGQIFGDDPDPASLPLRSWDFRLLDGRQTGLTPIALSVGFPGRLKSVLRRVRRPIYKRATKALLTNVTA